MLPNVEDIAALVRALDEARAEVERLRAALAGKPVIKSEWEQMCERAQRAEAEIERLRFDLQGIILERDQLLDIQKEKEKEIERLSAELMDAIHDHANEFYYHKAATEDVMSMAGRLEKAEERLAKVVDLATLKIEYAADDQAGGWNAAMEAVLAAAQPEERKENDPCESRNDGTGSLYAR